MLAVQQFYFLPRLDHFVHQPVCLGFVRRHIIIAIGIESDLLFRFAGVLRDDADQALFELEHVIDLALHVARLTLRAAVTPGES